MAIGSIKPASGQQGFSRAQATPAAFGAGVAQAIGGLANAFGDASGSIEDISTAVREREESKENFNTESAFILETTEMAKRQDDRLRNAPEDGAGLTNQTEEELNANTETWLDANIPEGRTDLRDKYSLLLSRGSQNQILQSFTFENDAFNAKALRDINEHVNVFAGYVYSGRRTMEEAQFDTDELIDTLPHIPEGERARMKEEAAVFYSTATFQFETQQALFNGNYMDTLGAQETNMLGAIAGPESSGQWNVRYGGAKGPQTFTDMSRHPGIFEEITSGPHKGEFSSAAGAFQITLTTWNRLQKIPELGLSDFSEASQTRAALYLLEERYNSVKPLGLTYAEVMEGGDPAQMLTIRDATSGKHLNNPLFEGWQNMSDTDFLAFSSGEKTVTFSNGVQPAPSIWDDARFENISQEDKFRLTSGARTSANTQMNAQNKLRYDALLTAVNAGNASREMILEAQAAGNITATQAQTLDTRFGAVNEAAITLETAQKNFLNPGFTWQNNEEHREQQNAVFGEEGALALRDKDEAYVNERLIPRAAQSGMIPTAAMDILSRQVNSTDPTTAMFAIRAMSALERTAPDSFTTGLKEHQRVVDFYQANGQFLTPEQLIERTQNVNSPQFAEARVSLKKDANANIKDFTLETFTQPLQVRGGLDANIVELSPTVSLNLTQDGSRLYRENYMYANGDHDTAMAMTNKQLARVWGSTEVGNDANVLGFIESNVGKNMPDRFPSLFPVQEDGLAWITQQVREEINVPDGTRFQLVADDQTQQELDQGLVPTYYIVFQDKEGMSQTAPGTALPALNADGTITTRPNPLPYRYRADYVGSSTMVSSDRALAAEREAAVVLRTSTTEEHDAQIERLNEGGGDPAILQAAKDELKRNKAEIKRIQIIDPEEAEARRRLLKAAEDEEFERRLKEAEE